MICCPVFRLLILSRRMDEQDYLDLWFAVLLRAIHDFLEVDQLHMSSVERRLVQRRAAAWLFESSNADLGSFVWVCHTLHLEPGFVRRVIERARINREARKFYTRAHVRSYAERRIEATEGKLREL